MAWRVDEVWLDADLLWFREEQRTPFGAAALAAPAFAGDLFDRLLFAPVETGLEASRRRRLASRAARRRKLATRTVPAVALVLGSATMLPIAALRHGSAGAAGPLLEDPPSLTFHAGEFGFHLPRKPAAPVRVERDPRRAASRRSSGRSRGSERPRRASGSQGASSTGRSCPSPGRTGSRGIRSRTGRRTSRGGCTGTSGRSGRSSR